MRNEKKGRRGKKKMDGRQEEREKESREVEESTGERAEERTEERTEEGTEEREEHSEVTEEACEDFERCEEESEIHSAKRAMVCPTFTDSQGNAIVEFVKEHPELYDKEHGHFHN